jgi:hypothetical protein
MEAKLRHIKSFFVCFNLFLLSLILLCMESTIAQNSVVEKNNSATSSNNPVWRQMPATPEEINKKIEKAALQAKDEGSISFSVYYNIAYPEDSSEYEALNGHAILMVTAISHNQEDLPLKSVCVQQDTERNELKLIRMVLSDQSCPFGKAAYTNFSGGARTSSRPFSNLLAI